MNESRITTLYRIALTGEEICSKLNEEMREFLIYSGHIANELNWISRWMLPLQRSGTRMKEEFGSTPNDEQFAIYEGNSAQVLLLSRIAAEKINEALAYLGKRVLKHPEFEKLTEDFTDKGRESLQFIREYLDRENKDRSKNLFLNYAE